jgi:hypothetical protein
MIHTFIKGLLKIKQRGIGFLSFSTNPFAHYKRFVLNDKILCPFVFQKNNLFTRY